MTKFTRRQGKNFSDMTYKDLALWWSRITIHASLVTYFTFFNLKSQICNQRVTGHKLPILRLTDSPIHPLNDSPIDHCLLLLFVLPPGADASWYAPSSAGRTRGTIHGWTLQPQAQPCVLNRHEKSAVGYADSRRNTQLFLYETRIRKHDGDAYNLQRNIL